MVIPQALLSLYSGEITEIDDEYYISFLASEIVNGDLDVGDTVTVGLFDDDADLTAMTDSPLEEHQSLNSSTSSRAGDARSSPSAQRSQSAPETNQGSVSSPRGSGGYGSERSDSDPRSEPQQPVEEGDVVELTVEDKGKKGDGIARIDGFVVIVPDTQESERV
ncbi:MAG: TRAM domain-containing protein, partial [Halobacteriaceae archaeon]